MNSIYQIFREAQCVVLDDAELARLESIHNGFPEVLSETATSENKSCTMVCTKESAMSERLTDHFSEVNVRQFFLAVSKGVGRPFFEQDEIRRLVMNEIWSVYCLEFNVQNQLEIQNPMIAAGLVFGVVDDEIKSISMMDSRMLGIYERYHYQLVEVLDTKKLN